MLTIDKLNMASNCVNKSPQRYIRSDGEKRKRTEPQSRALGRVFDESAHSLQIMKFKQLRTNKGLV
jgi:hypothetical protein